MTNHARANYATSRLDYPAALRLMFRPGHKLARTKNAKRAEYAVIPGGAVSELVAKRILGHTLCREDDRGLLAEKPQTWSFRTDITAGK
jgi:hypothetical protein